MKHNLKITLIIIFLFLLTQITGLFIISNYVTIEQVEKTVIQDGKEITVTTTEETWENLPADIERPKLQDKISYIQIFLSILIATALALLIIKFQIRKLWKIWFFLSVLLALTIAFKPFTTSLVAFIIALALTIFKVLRRSVIIHNFTELFIYGGLAAIFVPILSITAMFILLIIISIYDMIAVWKTKHMIKLAKFQSKENLFAGLSIPYGKNKRAILGGGDLGFPLLFVGVLFKQFSWLSLIVVLTTTIALSILLYKSQKNKFYPAMPFLTLGCIAGYVIISLMH